MDKGQTKTRTPLRAVFPSLVEQWCKQTGNTLPRFLPSEAALRITSKDEFSSSSNYKKVSNPIPRAKCGLNWSKPADSLKQHEKPVSWWQLVILKLSWKINGEIFKKCRLSMTGTDNLLMQFPITVCAVGRNGWAKWHTVILCLHFFWKT